MHSRHLLVLTIIVVFASPASAYIDPGAGSLILQLVLGGLAGLALTLKLYWRKLFGGLASRKDAVTPVDDDQNTTSG